jgi:hypothetical protein
MLLPSSLFVLLAALLTFIARASAQTQYGSFFQPIYINGVPTVGQVACASMGYSNYCCASGQYCSLDGNSALACCAEGQTCGSYNGQYVSPTSQYSWTTSTTCDCESDPTVTLVVTTQNNVVPVVAPAIITVTTTVGYQPLTTTYYTTTSTPIITSNAFVLTTFTTTPTTTIPTLITSNAFVLTTFTTTPMTTIPTLITETTPIGEVTTQIDNPGTCGSFSTIIAQGPNLPATKNCIVFISRGLKNGMAAMLGLFGACVSVAVGLMI